MIAWLALLVASAADIVAVTVESDPTVIYYYMRCGLPVPPSLRDVPPDDPRAGRIAAGWERDARALEALLDALPSYGASVADAPIRRVEAMIDDLAAREGACPATFAQAFGAGPFELVGGGDSIREPLDAQGVSIDMWAPAQRWRPPTQAAGFALAAAGVAGIVASSLQIPRAADGLAVSRGLRDADTYDPRAARLLDWRDVRAASITASATGLVVALVATLIPHPHARRGGPPAVIVPAPILEDLP